MNIIGIIAEYNPFHNGHLYMMEKIRAQFPDSVLIIIMSGSFCQRGEIAVLDKWTRAALAINGGADIVFELPFAFASRSGEFFAKGAVSILDRLNIVDMLAFGSEYSDLNYLLKIANSIDDTSIQEKIHNETAKGASYAAAITESLEENFDESANILHSPNAILAISYLRAIKKLNSNIEPFIIERKSVGHNDLISIGSFASATAVREELSKTNPDYSLLQKILPPKTFEAVKNPNLLYSHEKLFAPLAVKLYTTPIEKLQEIYGVNEGLENRILNAVKTSASIAEVIEKTSSKRYSKSRISRLAAHILTDFTKEAAKKIDDADELYARLLAFNEKGARILGSIKEKSFIPIVEKTSRFITEGDLRKNPANLSPLQLSIFYDIRGTFLQCVAKNSFENPAKDFFISPIYMKAIN